MENNLDVFEVLENLHIEIKNDINVAITDIVKDVNESLSKILNSTIYNAEKLESSVNSYFGRVQFSLRKCLNANSVKGQGQINKTSAKEKRLNVDKYESTNISTRNFSDISRAYSNLGNAKDHSIKKYNYIDVEVLPSVKTEKTTDESIEDAHNIFSNDVFASSFTNELNAKD